MRVVLIHACILLCVQISRAQLSPTFHGARATALGMAATSLADEYSLFNNIAGISTVEKTTAFAGYQSSYGIAEFQTIAAGLVLPRQDFTMGISFSRFGDALFNHQIARAAISNQIQLVRLGLAVEMHQYTIESIGSIRALSLSFGGIAEITPQLNFGLYASNLSQTKLPTQPETSLPTVLKAGLSYQPSEELLFTIEVEKELRFEELLKVGLEYLIIPKVRLRSGLQPQMKRATFGFGFHPDSIQIEYAFSTNPTIGKSHDLSLSYQLQR